MQVRQANLKDAEDIRRVHLQAFDSTEAELVADLAVNLLSDKSAEKIISLVVIDGDAIIGHVAFSPVFMEGSNELLGYILAPLAVLPDQQNKSVGSALVRYGLNLISSSGAYIVFVYGDPDYYSRFGFDTELAKGFTPPHKLQYPEGWHAIKSGSGVFPEHGSLKCVESLNDAELW